MSLLLQSKIKCNKQIQFGHQNNWNDQFAPNVFCYVASYHISRMPKQIYCQRTVVSQNQVITRVFETVALWSSVLNILSHGMLCLNDIYMQIRRCFDRQTHTSIYTYYNNIMVAISLFHAIIKRSIDVRISNLIHPWHCFFHLD